MTIGDLSRRDAASATPRFTLGRRAGLASAAFALAVIGVGILAQATGLRPAGLIFAAAVAALAMAVLLLLVREHPSRGAALAAVGGRRQP
jgi:hypothetical protein